MQKAHGVDNRSSVRLVKCPLCEEDFKTLTNVCEHISKEHNVPLKKETAGSGSSQTTGTGKIMKWSQSHKTGEICPAGMTTTNIDGYITIEFRRTHVGHALNMKFLHLSKEERDELAGKIKSGVIFEQILDDIQKSVTATECVNCFHAVDKRDLYNIKRDYDLDRDSVHANDAFSTEIWVQEQMLLKEKSPVTYFKMQCEKEGPLLKDDFMIVIMTPYQIDVLSKYATDRICVNSTHGITSHDFQLTTLLVVDEFGAGCPVALCISNRNDSVAMSRFFLSSKEKVNRSWRKNLIKIKSLIKQSEVYKACRTLMEILDIDQFQNSLECFLAMCEDDVEIKDFGIYFKTYYSQLPKAWTFCYRLDLSLNTYMYLEAMHKKLKYCYMHGKQNRRVDKCSRLLMRFARDMITFKTTTTRHKIIKIQDQEDFNKHVLSSKEPVVIDFFATWCGPCKMLLPRVEKIIEESKGTIHLAKVDIDDNAEIAMEYGVSVVPELVLMKGGEVQGKMIGLQDEDKLKHFISKLTELTIEKK
ncbi:hypothetical protein QTP88_026703 [Uroleucon formosanum]